MIEVMAKHIFTYTTAVYCCDGTKARIVYYI